MLIRVLAVIAVTVTTVPPASAKERAELELGRIQSTAQREVDAAQADFDLVSATGLAMHRAYRAGGPNMASAIDASLGLLRKRIPDKRLHYTGEKDRCAIFDAFADIRGDTIYRLQRASDVVKEAAMRLEIYHRLSADILLAQMKGELITEKTISDSFMQTLNAQEELAVFSSNNMLDAPYGQSECD